MKLYHVRAKKWLGPGTPLEGVVREEDEAKAVEAFIDPNPTPFSGVNLPPTRFWHAHRLPKVADFDVKPIGQDDRYEPSYGAALRDPERNTGEVLSAQELECRRFLEDRVVMRDFTGGGFFAKILYSSKIYLAKWLYQLAQKLEESTNVEP